MAASIFGYEVASEMPLERLLDADAPRGRLELVRARRPLADVEGELIARAEVRGGPQWLSLTRTRDGLLGECSETGAFLVETDPVGRIHAEPRDGTGFAWQHRMTATALPLAVVCLGDLVLHASAVLLPEGAVLFCGPSGRGKSTLALLLSRAGYRVLAEDGVVVDLTATGPVAWPGPHGIRTVGAAGEMKRVEPVPPGLRATSPAPVLAVVSLAPRGPDGPQVERLDPVTAARALIGSAIVIPGAAFARAFGQCARLAEAVPVYRASMPDDLALTAALAPEVLARVSRKFGSFPTG